MTIIIKSEYNDYNNKVTKVIVINKSGFTIPVKNGHIKWFYHSSQKWAYKVVLPFQLKMEVKVDGIGNFTI